eukprot:jgi/Botrbrau1/6587/Bobra.0189s0014.1
MGETSTDAVIPIRLIAGDDLGLLKVVQAPSESQLSSAKVVATWGKPDREQLGITAMHVSCSASADTLMAVARSSSKIEILDAWTGVLCGSVPAVPRVPGAGPQVRGVTGLSFLHTSDSAPQRLLSCTRGGVMRIHTHQEAEAPEDLPQCPSWLQAASWNVSAEVCSLAVAPGAREAAVGTQGTSQLTVWDLNTQQRLYLAKGAKPNAIGLVDKPWDSALTYLRGGEARKVAVGTGYHKIRIYDVKAQRRPVLEIPFGESRVTSLAADIDGYRVWAGNAVGALRAVDLRVGRLQEGLKGSSGSIRALSTHPSLPLLVSAGLDRFLRVYHTGTRALAAKVYLKQAVTAVQFCPAAASTGEAAGTAAKDTEEKAAGEDEKEEEEEEEEEEEDKYGGLEVLMTDGGEDGGDEEGEGDGESAEEEVGATEVKRRKEVRRKKRQGKSGHVGGDDSGEKRGAGEGRRGGGADEDGIGEKKKKKKKKKGGKKREKEEDPRASIQKRTKPNA